MDDKDRDEAAKKDRERWDEAHQISTYLKRVFLEPHLPNEPTLLESLIASMKYTEHQSWGAKWLIRLAVVISTLWAVVVIVMEILSLVQGIAG